MNSLSPEVFAQLNDGVVHYTSDLPVGLPSIDSRTIGSAETFYALHGPRFDGHDFVDIALERGAGTVVVNHDRAAEFKASETSHTTLISVENTERALQRIGCWYREQFEGRVVGITGSSGKTTTKEMLRIALAAHGIVVATKGNLNNHLGVPLSLSQLASRPDFGVFEMGMNAPGEILQLSAWVNADVAVITSIGEAHLEGVGSLEGVAKAKGEIFETLKSAGVAICPSDVPYFDYLRGVAGERLRTVGKREDDTCRIVQIDLVEEQSIVAFEINGERLQMTLPCIGHHHISNALCALLAVSSLGLSLQPSLDALRTFQLPSMRGERFVLVDGTSVSLDCYNANPQSMRAAINSHLQHSDDVAALILGDMLELGSFSGRAHASLGEFIASTYPWVMVIAVGEQMRALVRVLEDSEQYTGVVSWASDAMEAHEILTAHRRNKMNILIKGSRGLKLETVWQEMQR
ncbi:MAG: UDP-N-acetylmuramoyl-tripeptide--D-alanyl-D-alanine ligase [Bradymonadia bacterium]